MQQLNLTHNQTVKNTVFATGIFSYNFINPMIKMTICKNIIMVNKNIYFFQNN
ncbi:hypothetical protein [Mycoplasmopsis iners]|uniref:hypothetical protein n=1 Tax=Mycoplasmopsis iners TaxID=76630 RepID=UPI000B18C595|nr:hypothetical protein [Mycoplasmopsis iners]